MESAIDLYKTELIKATVEGPRRRRGLDCVTGGGDVARRGAAVALLGQAGPGTGQQVLSLPMRRTLAFGRTYI
jgi:hypothetical protein